MTLAQGVLLLQLVNMGIDTGLKMSFAFDKIMGMTPEQVNAAINTEHVRTDLLVEIAHQI